MIRDPIPIVIFKNRNIISTSTINNGDVIKFSISVPSFIQLIRDRIRQWSSSILRRSLYSLIRCMLRLTRKSLLLNKGFFCIRLNLARIQFFFFFSF